ncbi:hypothetical protein L5515_003187 [Caenorhabditis briggsae]|uniref:Uncharacterized protein n=1 Tax=Caenorhabditis briggsae TaxID=6238 RepID=A0AAE9EHL8_CAEBR|nr:hypothetical protein L5515_003187 [Caenorhabditis briggsae]
MRKKIGTQIGWFLTAKQLKQPKDLIEPIQHTINLQPVARHRISRRDESGDQQYITKRQPPSRGAPNKLRREK